MALIMNESKLLPLELIIFLQRRTHFKNKRRTNYNSVTRSEFSLGLWCLTPLSTIFSYIVAVINIEYWLNLSYHNQVCFFTLKDIRLYVRVGNLPTYGKHLNDPRIRSLRGEAWAHKTCLILPLLIEMLVSSQDSERPCIRLLEIPNLPLSHILIFDFGVIPTV